MYVDAITRPTFEYANQIPCENNPQNVISLDPDTDYVSTPQPKTKTLHYSLNQLKFNLLLVQTPLLPKMQSFILKNFQTFSESCSFHQAFE